MSEPAPNILAAALAAYDAGLCVIQARIDGTKAPVGKWERWQHERPTRQQVEAWFATGHPGLGVVCGNVSGDLEMFELEGRFMERHGHEFFERIKAAGIELPFRRLINGFQMQSPKDGRNFLYRVAGPVDGNTKLARDAHQETLIETRGEGGFVVLAPSHGPTHPTGKPWVVREGSIDNIPTLTLDERAALFAVARSFDEAPPAPPPPPPSSNRCTRATRWSGGKVGDSWFDTVVAHLNATEDMRKLLERHGWTWCYADSRGRQLLRRPGKDEGVSGSINENGRFCPFSTSVPFESSAGHKQAHTYDVLDVIATYEHSGERNEAARHFAEVTGILEAWKAEQVPEVTVFDDEPPPHVDAETGEVKRSRNLPDEFWNARPELAHIRQAAHSRARSPDAVLIAVLGRLCATIPPRVMLPPIVGGAASANMAAALVGTSGSGKTTAADVARELYPIVRTDVVADMPLGSGEGLIDLYFEMVAEDGGKKEKKRQTKSGLFMCLDEGQALAEMGNRKGSTLLTTLRTAWSGATVGQSNASVETRRVLKSHTYRMAVLIGFQVEYAKGLLDDAAGGTPQRFVYACANDPAIPDDPPPWPGPLEHEAPAFSVGDMLVEVDPEVAGEIRQRNVMAARGQLALDLLDSHRDLVRLKVAMMLAYLDGGRFGVTRDDWDLAGAVMDTSDEVRSWILATAKQKAAAEESSAARRAAAREIAVASTVETKALASAAKSVGKKVHKAGGEVGRSDLMRSVASKHRALVSLDDILAEAERLEWITPIDGETWGPGRSAPA